MVKIPPRPGGQQRSNLCSVSSVDWKPQGSSRVAGQQDKIRSLALYALWLISLYLQVASCFSVTAGLSNCFHLKRRHPAITMSSEATAGTKRERERDPSPSQVLEFLSICGKLKKTVRTGWRKSGIDPCESVADHSWRMGVLAMMLPADLDRHHCIKMAIVHDLAEAIVGDISPHCGVSDEEKFRRESEAMAAIRSATGDSEVGREIERLWKEYEAGETPEAKGVKDLDKFEMIVQAEEYEKETGTDLEQFFTSTKGKIKHPVMKGWEEELRDQRAKRKASEK